MSVYWSQWSYTELMSMHGIEIDDIDQDEHDIDSCHEILDIDLNQNQELYF